MNTLNKQMFKPLFNLLICTLIGLGALSQNDHRKKLDSYFDTLFANNKFMGSVAVSHSNRIIYTKSVGYSDVSNKTLINKETKLRIGSVSKTFTAVLVLKAIEQGKLSLHQSIEGFFPEIKRGSEITILHLLSHRSGIPNFTDDEDFMSYYTQAKTKEEMLIIIASNGSNFKPNRKAEYSNSNFVLLSIILEEIYNQTYGELLSLYITQPLGLKNTYVGSKINVLNNEAKSYSYSHNGWKEQAESNLTIPLGARSIVSTPVDLVRFMDELLCGSLLSPKSLNQMVKIREKFGLGLYTFNFDKKIGYGHSGAVDAFKSQVAFYSHGQVSYAILSNGSDFEIDSISNAVLSAIYNVPYQIPVFQEYKVDSEILDHYVGNYTSEEIPIKLKISREGNKLLAQGDQQQVSILTATGIHRFKFDKAGATFTFVPTRNELILNQDGRDFLFKK